MADIELRADQSYSEAGQAVIGARAREMFARAEA